MIEQSVITCPGCGFAKSETMPTNACQFFYECEGCGALLRPKDGDCCVFCSFGSVPCPPVQGARYGGKPAGCCGNWNSNRRRQCPRWVQTAKWPAYGMNVRSEAGIEPAFAELVRRKSADTVAKGFWLRERARL